jgi:hypothetical protein
VDKLPPPLLLLLLLLAERLDDFTGRPLRSFWWYGFLDGRIIPPDDVQDVLPAEIERVWLKT